MGAAASSRLLSQASTMASMAQRGNTPSTQMARQYWSQHNWDNMERLRMLDPYAEPRNVSGERLESQLPIQGTSVLTTANPMRMLHLMRQGSLTQVAKEYQNYKNAGGDINERMLEDYISPGVRELDTFLHVALRHGNSEVAKFLMVNGSDAGIQNWHLETPLMVAEGVGLTYLVQQMGQGGAETKWGGATLNKFANPIQVAPQRSIVEAHYAWREGAPKTVAPTKAVFTYHQGSNAMSTRKPVPAPLPYQRENGPSAAVHGRSGSRAHHHSSGYRSYGPAGAPPPPAVAGTKHAGAR